MTLEAHSTMVSNRLNEVMKTLTVFATLALPLVIVTGIYGMNFSEHPGLGPRWLYHLFSVLLLGSIPVMLCVFRWFRWLESLDRVDRGQGGMLRFPGLEGQRHGRLNKEG